MYKALKKKSLINESKPANNIIFNNEDLQVVAKHIDEGMLANNYEPVTTKSNISRSDLGRFAKEFKIKGIIRDAATYFTGSLATSIVMNLANIVRSASRQDYTMRDRYEVLKWYAVQITGAAAMITGTLLINKYKMKGIDFYLTTYDDRIIIMATDRTKLYSIYLVYYNKGTKKFKCVPIPVTARLVHNPV